MKSKSNILSILFLYYIVVGCSVSKPIKINNNANTTIEFKVDSIVNIMTLDETMGFGILLGHCQKMVKQHKNMIILKKD